MMISVQGVREGSAHDDPLEGVRGFVRTPAHTLEKRPS